MKSCRTPGGYSKGGTGYPLDAPYASASGPVSENTGPDCAKTSPSKTSAESNASSKRRIMVPSTSKIDGLIRSITALGLYLRMERIGPSKIFFLDRPRPLHEHKVRPP